MFLNSCKRKTLAASVLMASLGLSACGGGGGTASVTATNVKVEDAIIVGARVIDANGSEASEVGAGIYRFANTPSPPIKVRTKNTGATVTTYQDMDGNGAYDSAVDIPYNTAMNINYVPPGTNETIQANPLTSLIPSTWDGLSEIAGISATVMNKVLATNGTGGLTSSQLSQAEVKTTKLVAAQLTAVQESLTQMGVAEDDVAAAFVGVTGNLTTNFGSAISASLDTNLSTADANVVLQAKNIATAIETLMETNGTDTETNVEAIVKVAQDVTPTGTPSTVTDLTSTIATNYTSTQQSITTAVNDATSALVASLYVVPAYNYDALPDNDLGTVQDLVLIYSVAEGSISFTSSSSQAFDTAFKGQALSYNAQGSGYFYRDSEENPVNVIGVTLSTTFEDENGDFVSGRLMTYSMDSGLTSHVYLLANQDEICNLGSNYLEETVGSMSRLEWVNAVNAQKDGADVSCP